MTLRATFKNLQYLTPFVAAIAVASAAAAPVKNQRTKAKVKPAAVKTVVMTSQPMRAKMIKAFAPLVAPKEQTCAAELVIDLDTGEKLHRINEDSSVMPASTTKLLTALTLADLAAEKNIDGKSTMDVAISTEGTSIHAEYCPTDTFRSKLVEATLDQAQQASLVSSHLFATLGISAKIKELAGTDTVKTALDQTLIKLGVSNKTMIYEPAGTSNIRRCIALDSKTQNWTTANDAMKWVRASLRHPKIFTMLMEEQGDLAGAGYNSTNTFLVTPYSKKERRLLTKEFPRSSGDVAMKTGYTGPAKTSGLGIIAWPKDSILSGQKPTRQLGIAFYGCENAYVRHQRIWTVTEQFNPAVNPLATVAKNPDSHTQNNYPAFGTNGTVAAAIISAP